MLIGAALAVLAYLGLCAVMFFTQRSLLYFPQPSRFATPQSTMRLAVPEAVLDVTVRPLAGARALLYLGGNGEDVSQELETFSRAFPDQALYLLHYRGYGLSTGKPSERANVEDAIALFDQVAREHPQVSVIGRSLGSGIAVHLASERPVARLILVTPYDSILQIATGQYPYIPVRWLMLDRYESWRYAPAIKAPTMLIAAANDEVIPRASTVQLLGRFAPGVASLTTVANVGHNDIDVSPDYLRVIQSVLQ